MSEGGTLVAAAVGSLVAPGASVAGRIVTGVDVLLKRLAEVSLAVSEAEEAVEDGAFHLASERLDLAREGLGELRAGWLAMSVAERRVIGGAAQPVRARLEAAAGRVPRLRAISEMPAAVADPEQEADPEAG